MPAPAPLRPLQSRWTTLPNGLRLHTRSGDGTGPDAVVLVPGLVVSSRNVVPTARRLDARFSVHCVDLPGYGCSDDPRHVPALPELADSLADWMDAAGLARAHFIGNSFGCQVLADLATRHPVRVSRLVLTGPALDPAIRRWWPPVLRLALDALYEPGLILPALRDVLDLGPRRVLGTYAHALADAIEEDLPHIPMPALVLRGSRDPIASAAWCERVAARLPDARLETLPGAAHAILHGGAAAEVARRAGAFFAA